MKARRHAPSHILFILCTADPPLYIHEMGGFTIQQYYNVEHSNSTPQSHLHTQGGSEYPHTTVFNTVIRPPYLYTPSHRRISESSENPIVSSATSAFLCSFVAFHQQQRRYARRIVKICCVLITSLAADSHDVVAKIIWHHTVVS